MLCILPLLINRREEIVSDHSEQNRDFHKQGFQGYRQVSHAVADAELTHVGPSTPCGEYMRRYWQPVAMSSELTDLPMLVGVLGETLVLFRDGSGRTGLLHRHCSHRGASLEYGIVAERGIICCYHGWHYDIDGTLIQAGSERVGSPLCRKVVHGAYPTHEHNGLIFAYLGPPEEVPDFPVYDTESMPGTEAVPFSITTPCNWLQVYENTQDPIHVLHLHARSSGVQFGAASGVEQTIDYSDTPLGMMNIQARHVGGHIWARTTDSILPNANQTGAIFEEAECPKYFQRVSMLRWMLPVDNTTTRTIGWRFFSPALDPRGQCCKENVGKESIDFVGQTADERPYQDRQRQPGDYEAQVSQRPIAIHANENLTGFDAGVVRLRGLLRRHIRALQNGEPVPRPVPQPGGIPSYCQDTVTAWKDSAGQGETAILRAYGRRVADAVLSTDTLAPAARAARIRTLCEQGT